MMAGLSRDSPESLGCLRPPLALPRVPGAQNHPSPPSPAKTRTSQSTKGGHHEKKQTQRRARKEKSKNKDGDTRSSSGEDSTRLSSDGESSSGSSSGVAWQSRYQRGSDSNGGTSKSRFKGPRGKIGVSSSESDVSDSEASRMNAVMSKIRLEAHSSLALLFQVRYINVVVVISVSPSLIFTPISNLLTHDDLTGKKNLILGEGMDSSVTHTLS